MTIDATQPVPNQPNYFALAREKVRSGDPRWEETVVDGSGKDVPPAIADFQLRNEMGGKPGETLDLQLTGEDEGRLIYTAPFPDSEGKEKTMTLIDEDGNGPDRGDVYLGPDREVCTLVAADGSVVTHTYRYQGEEVEHLISSDDPDYNSCRHAPLAVGLYSDFLRGEFSPSRQSSVWRRGEHSFLDNSGEGAVSGGDQLITSGLYFSVQETDDDRYVALVLDPEKTGSFEESVTLRVPVKELYEFFH